MSTSVTSFPRYNIHTSTDSLYRSTDSGNSMHDHSLNHVPLHHLHPTQRPHGYPIPSPMLQQQDNQEQQLRHDVPEFSNPWLQSSSLTPLPNMGVASTQIPDYQFQNRFGTVSANSFNQESIGMPITATRLEPTFASLSSANPSEVPSHIRLSNPTNIASNFRSRDVSSTESSQLPPMMGSSTSKSTLSKNETNPEHCKKTEQDFPEKSPISVEIANSANTSSIPSNVLSSTFPSENRSSISSVPPTAVLSLPTLSSSVTSEFSSASFYTPSSLQTCYAPALVEQTLPSPVSLPSLNPHLSNINLIPSQENQHPVVTTPHRPPSPSKVLHTENLRVNSAIPVLRNTNPQQAPYDYALHMEPTTPQNIDVGPGMESIPLGGFDINCLGTSLVAPPTAHSMMYQFKATAPPQKKHICKVCRKGFARPSSLQTHIYSHTGEKPFPCEVENCGRRFSVVSNLRRHQKVHQKSSGLGDVNDSGSVCSEVNSDSGDYNSE